MFEKVIIGPLNFIEEVYVSYGTGKCNLVAKRNYKDKTYGQPTCGFNPDGTAGEAVVVGRATDFGGSLVAMIVNYACYPTETRSMEI